MRHHRVIGLPALLLLLILPPPLALADEPPTNTWTKLCDGPAEARTGGVLVPDGARRLLLLGGGEEKLPPTEELAPAEGGACAWKRLDLKPPTVPRGLHCTYAAAVDPKTRTLYCLSDGRLHTLDLAGGKWTDRGEVKELADLSWPTMAIDTAARRLVVVGSDKCPENVGWTRTAVMDLDSGEWSTLPLPPDEIVTEHKRFIMVTSHLIELSGRARSAWYRDPNGRGTDKERADLVSRSVPLALAGDVGPIFTHLDEGKLLDFLHATRALQRMVERNAESCYPVPPSRRNSPLVYDPDAKVFVLFGGDHEDYLTNDTWVLDLDKGWRRAAPPAAPSPRAGHAMVYLPGLKRVALIGGYCQSNANWYGTRPWELISPRQVWLYDVKTDHWELATAFGGKGDERAAPPATETFYGYAAQYYSAPAAAAFGEDRLLLAVPPDGKRPGQTWAIRPAATDDAELAAKLARPADERLYRTERFLASYCKVPDMPEKRVDLEELPANRWVCLADPPRNVAYGCRQRDWGTAAWDSRRGQFLLWGGGHCVRAASTVIHYSPLTQRMVEGFDADEPYSANGSGGYDSSLMNRPWCGPHGYNLYAFDPPSGMLVSARGYLYDPDRMDWRRDGPVPRPFRYQWGGTVLETTPHGVVAWASTAENVDTIGLWLYEHDKGWTDLKPAGKLYAPYCDSEGIAYDGKRDRLLLGWGGGYNKRGDGSITSFDFKTRAVAKLTPANSELGQISNTREMVVVDHADWVVFAEPYKAGEGKAAKSYLRVYDCAADAWKVLDVGPGPADSTAVHSQGWAYDAARKLVFVLTFRGEAWTLRLEPAEAKLMEKP